MTALPVLPAGQVHFGKEGKEQSEPLVLANGQTSLPTTAALSPDYTEHARLRAGEKQEHTGVRQSVGNHRGQATIISASTQSSRVIEGRQLQTGRRPAGQR